VIEIPAWMRMTGEQAERAAAVLVARDVLASKTPFGGSNPTPLAEDVLLIAEWIISGERPFEIEFVPEDQS